MPHGVIGNFEKIWEGLENFEKTQHFPTLPNTSQHLPIILNTTAQYSTKSEQVKVAMPIFLNFSPAPLLKKA